MNVKIVNGLDGNGSVTITDSNGDVMVSLKDCPEFPVSGDIKMESDNVLIVGGRRIECGKRIAGINICGNVKSVQNLPNIVVNGNVSSVSTTSGDVTVHGDVNGSVSAVSGDVEVRGSVAGSVSTVSGDVDVRNNQQ